MFMDEEHIRCTFEQLWEKSLIGIALVAEDGTFIHANPAFCKITEYVEAELQRKKYQDITHPEDVDADMEMAERTARGHIAGYTMKKRYLTKTGRIVWIVLRVSPVRVKERLEFFVSQASEVIELSPPKLPKQYPGSQSVASYWLEKLHKGWPMLALFLMSLGIIVAEVIKRLS